MREYCLAIPTRQMELFTLNAQMKSALLKELYPIALRYLNFKRVTGENAKRNPRREE